MATIIEPYTYRRGFKEPAETNPWEPNMVNGATDGDVEDEKQHYDVPPSVELLTSPVHNYLGYNYMRTWPTIYDGTASPHGPPSWWKPSSKVDVLICGAGPCGLEAAVSLTRQGVSFRIVDKAPTPLLAGRADGVQPRYLETLSSWGLEDEVAEEGPLIERTAIYKNGKLLHHGRSHQSDSRYRGLHVITQGQIERILIRDLCRHKVLVERNTIMTSYSVDSNQGETNPVRATIENVKTGEKETIEAKFIIGTDGAASSIRRELKIPFEGISTDIYWGIMDCIFESDYPHAWTFGSVISSKHGGCVIIPREQGYIRLYTQLDVSSTGPIAQSRIARDPNFLESGGGVDAHSITADEVLEQANKIFAPYKLKFGAPLSWFAVWKISERVAGSFSSQDMRVHLGGDAAHVHSVMGAFGLNASILDAANLAWKIGLCSKGAAKIDALMPTYDSERRNHAAKIIEISGRYLRFVCNSVLPVAQLLKAGRDPGFDSNGLPIEGRASDNSNGIESHKLDTENADESPNERNGTLNGNGTNGTYTNGSARQSNGPVKGTGKISSHDDYTEADLQKDREWLGGFFSEYGQFLLGTDAPYGKSCIVLQIGDNPGAAKRLASSVGNGVRAPNPRVCFNNDRTGYLYDKMKGASRFHLIVFGSDLLGPARRHLTELSRALTDPQSFYNRFGAQDRFNIVLVVKGVPFELEDKFGSGPLDTLRAAAEVVCDDRPPEEDAHSTYGVDHSTGAIIAVRPDLWVGMSAIPSDLECLDGYFSSFLVPVSSN